MALIPAHLVDPSMLSREYLATILENAGFDVIRQVVSVEDLPQDEAEAAALVLIDSGGIGHDVAASLALLRLAQPTARIVVLADTRGLDFMMRCYGAPIDGVVSKNISSVALVSSLRLVLTGERVFPTQMLSMLLNRQPAKPASAPASQSAPQRAAVLTERETQILQCLTTGDSNKSIARHLGTAEATVKVHLKSILRKINARNRTQAALWAIGNGIDPSEMRASAMS